MTLYTNVDALGSVHDAQTDGDYPRDQRRFEAFGGQVGGSGADTFALGFAASSSYQTDADTGLMLLGNRYYDPSIGRFLSEDPAGDGDNWYAYCGNDPLDGLDPEGLFATGMAAPNGASYGNPGAQYASASASAQSLTDHFYRVDYYRDGWQKDERVSHDYIGSDHFGDYSGYFQLVDDEESKLVGRPVSHEPGEENGVKGVYKTYKNGYRGFVPDPVAEVKKRGHGDGGRNQGADEEHGIRAKGNRTPRSTGGANRFAPVVQAGGWALGGYLLYEGVKWTIAAVAAPETLGLSLAAAALAP